MISLHSAPPSSGHGRLGAVQEVRQRCAPEGDQQREQADRQVPERLQRGQEGLQGHLEEGGSRWY